MNAERLHAIVSALKHEIDTRGIVNRLQEVVNALKAMTGGDPSQQQRLTQNLSSLFSALNEAESNNFSPGWRLILDEIGGAELFGNALRAKVTAIIESRQIMPAVAADELQMILKELQEFKKATEQCIFSLRHFRIGNEKLEPGQCEIGLLIPRREVNNQLDGLCGELEHLSFILNTFSEVVTGKKDDLKIRAISSSELLVYLQALAPYAACVALAIERIVALYKNLLEIRKLHSELKSKGVPEENAKGIEDHANNLMANGIDSIADEIMTKYHEKKNAPRLNELRNAVRISLFKLANRIDRGFNIEVRVESIDSQQEDGPIDQATIDAVSLIRSAAANMQFLKLVGQPILSLPEQPDKPGKSRA